jgi:hypothetical protein
MLKSLENWIVPSYDNGGPDRKTEEPAYPSHLSYLGTAGFVDIISHDPAFLHLFDQEEHCDVGNDGQQYDSEWCPDQNDFTQWPFMEFISVL